MSPSYETELGHAPTAVLGEVSKLTHVFGSPGTAAMDGTLTAAFEAKGTHAAFEAAATCAHSIEGS